MLETEKETGNEEGAKGGTSSPKGQGEKIRT